MSSTFHGHKLHISVFGQSHSEAIGVTLDGLPAGISVDLDELQSFLNRRAPGRNEWSTKRKEEDVPEFLCGLMNGFTCGAPLTAVIYNRNKRASDYSAFQSVPRPGHADYTAMVKYKGYQDFSGGGHFSGRMTAPLCVAGGILIQELFRKGIRIRARILSIAGICDVSDFTDSVSDKSFPVVSDEAGEKMRSAIRDAHEEGDSVGGIIECVVDGVPAGIGEPIFDGIENQIARLAFAIPAVKGIEFGAGFAVAKMRGSENNDAFTVIGDRVVTETNHSGGILGGITSGNSLVFRIAVKPTPSISKVQHSVNLGTLQSEELKISGRHDPCIVPRAVPVAEAIAAIAVADYLLGVS